ncbi:MAG TPA: DNA mismatch repair endonuclease MutL, partial [Bacteroidota bacterium]|nr:DNA mismatch repair endonuclease MutL [Bacteroidota bacterium]
DEQDARASFLRHATSKIASYEELESVTSFGFRGEALASIAAVARVTMKTRRREDESATVVKIDGGGPPALSREGREPGTTLTVQNLFYNVPARRKFLKSASTEFRHVYEEVQHFAISRPGTAIHFISDDDTVFNVKPAPLLQRLGDVLGERRCEGLIAVEEKTDTIAVTGFIGKPAFGLRSRQAQYVFLNGRFIVNRTINHAVYSAYEHLLDKGTFPFFLLFLEVDPHRVDVNVHPSKLEAKFDDEQSVYRVVSSLTRRALANADGVPALTIQEGGIEPGTVGAHFTQRQHSWPGTGTGSLWSFPERGPVDTKTGEILPFVPSQGVAEGGTLAARLLAGAGRMEGTGEPPLPEGGPLLPHDIARPEPGQATLIWQLHNKYILSQIKNGLLIVDQHVAHERVLYEKALARFATSLRSTQQLLFPYTLELSAADYALLEELLPDFDMLGFDIKPFGRHTVLIEGVPPDTHSGSEGKIVEEMLALYGEYRQNDPTHVRDNLAKSYSCKSAIKAGDPLNEAEMRSLIDQLFATSMPYVCPHGRPVVLRISIEELDRRFGRTS